MKKKIIVLSIIFLLIMIPSRKVYATTLKDLKDELSALESSYNAAKNKSALTQSQINQVKSQIASAEAQIVQAQNDITTAENNIVASEASIEEKKEQTNQMLLYLQLTGGDDSYFQYLFEAEDYTDFIYRYSIVTQLSDYNNTLMDELNSLILELQNKKVELANKQTELAKQKQELQGQYALLQIQYKDDQAEGLSLADQISEKKKLVNYYSKICSDNQNITSCGGTLPFDGWAYPLSSFYQSSSYAESRGSTYHYAVDLATYGAEGKNVYAAANGTVISSTLPTKKASCYSEWLNKSWTNCYCGGYVIQIKHDNGYVTLYMHLLEGYVSVGDSVTKGQVIGLSGGGETEANKYHDYCTAGAHLHFSIATGQDLIGYSSQKGSTFDPVKFFPAMRGEGSSY